MTDDLAAELEGLTAALGRAVSRWASVEDSLGGLFAFVVTGDRHAHHAKAAFDAVMGFKTKLAMTDAAGKWRFTSAQHTTWAPLRKRLDRAAGQRNELAHFAIVMAQPPGPDGRTYSVSCSNRHQLGVRGRRPAVYDPDRRFFGGRRRCRSRMLLPPCAGSDLNWAGW